MKKNITLSTVAFVASIGASAVSAQSLDVVCSNEQSWCDLIAQNFQIDTGVDVAIVRKSTGETLAQIRAEAGNPRSTSGGAALVTRTLSPPPKT